MNKLTKRIVSLVLAALLVFALAGCKVTTSSSSTVTAALALPVAYGVFQNVFLEIIPRHPLLQTPIPRE